MANKSFTFAYGNAVSATSNNSHAIGTETFAGTNLYRIKYGNASTNVWYLDNVNGLSTGMSYSARIINNYDNAGTILSINSDDNSISTTPFPTFTADGEKRDDIVGIAYSSNSDENTIWILGHPELGELNLDGCQVANGYGTVAQKQCAKADGLYTLAAGKYSHAEGRETSAFGWASHAEGISSIASAQRSHAEGQCTSAFGSYSHAEGLCCMTNGSASHASGSHSIAKKDRQFVWNGLYSTYDPTTTVSAEDGAFCINPKNGISGFFIGNESLGNILGNSGNIGNRFDVAESNIANIENNTGISGYIDYVADVSSSWYVRVSDTRVRSETTAADFGKAYTQFKYVVDGGKKYHFKTGFSANNAAALFKYDENFDTPPENTVSCLDYSKLDDLDHPNKICEMDVVVPTNYSKYILAFVNCKTILPNDQIEVIAYCSETPINKVVEQNTNNIAELSNNLIGISNRLAEILA